MEELIQLLVNLEKDETIPVSEYIDVAFIENIQTLACALLIDEDGLPLWDAVNDLLSKGYPVFPIERDRFGWLIGGIETKKGIIPYG